MQVRYGSTRIVFVVRKRAYKFPRLLSWKHFLWGLLGNLQEAEFSRTGWPELCPVLWSLPGGFLVVMPRAEICSDENAPSEEQLEELINRPDYAIPAERKADSWGFLDGRLVATDYGS